MRIILTHEQTDFDGIASILGAHLVDETASPILPRRMNRNVKAFITIYGSDLPFIDPRDIGDQPIDYIYLVDTQSLTSIKGMHSETIIHVIDHHPIRNDLPLEWDINPIETGANVTIFVEEICERGIGLNTIEATLLLLGIYEDTGSLTYSQTSPRDIRAAANLLELGANLSIVNNFTNHPLSLQQQVLFDTLRATSISRTIHGHDVLIAPGDARGMDEELSTIVHKLRDLVDPDLIIMIVNIRGGIQLIARSTSDNINVAKIAAHFGGGGHPRAAAAMIKTEDRETIFKELIDILPELIQPAVTVGEIMSSVPQLLSPETPIKQVNSQMQRFGYEGYPVVQAGKIMGLVTRRAVDRALSHKLNLNAESIMEAGDVSISPGASIEDLQSLMTTTGWGQIPVVDPVSGNIVGIVTRTDLLETLAPPTIKYRNRNLIEELEKALPFDRLTLLKEIALIAQKQHAALYIVGGFVRDLIIGYPSLDFDLVVEGDAICLASSVVAVYGGRITTHKQFGTAKWFLDQSKGNSKQYLPGKIDSGNEYIKSVGYTEVGTKTIPETLDFITARREFYSHPTALPTVERGSIKLDLHRRDFTINTLAIRLDGTHFGNLYDYWGGYNDIRQGLIRVLHSISFVDDPTRMLRAVRYEQRYGFQIGKRTLQLLSEARSLLNRVSGDRIRNELDNILKEKNAIQMLERLASIKLLEAIHPDLDWDKWIREKVENIEQPCTEWGLDPIHKGLPLQRILFYTLWLIRLTWSRAEKVTSRLRLPRIVVDIIKDACQLWSKLPEMKEAQASTLSQLFDKAQTISIYGFFLAIDDSSIRESALSYITEWKFVKPTITGNDLKTRNLPPGPHYKEILYRLKSAWIDGKITSPEEESELLNKLTQNYFRQYSKD
jgi:tRNA nucleotidyltransferase (CCA-adding enzyme)